MDIEKGTIGLTLNKKWEDKTDQEKIEALRNKVRDFRYMVDRIVKLETKLREFEDHQHGAQGQMMLPIKERYGNENDDLRDMINALYFGAACLIIIGIVIAISAL